MPSMLHLVTIVCLLASAWLISRGAAFVARRVLLWHDRRNEAAAANVSVKIQDVKRRETTVAVIRATIAYAAFSAAIVLSVAQVTGGFDKLTTVAGASFMLILAAYAVQRLLTDVIAGLMMFAERWYYVGDAIAIPTLEIQGVVEDVSLRRTKLRTRAGEGLILHGPVVLSVDEVATRSFARASAATRWAGRPEPAPSN